MSGTVADRLKRKQHEIEVVANGEKIAVVIQAVPLCELFADGVTPPMLAVLMDAADTPDEDVRAKLTGPDLALLFESAAVHGLVCPRIVREGEPTPSTCGRGHEGCSMVLADLGVLQGVLGRRVLEVSGFSVQEVAATRFRDRKGVGSGTGGSRAQDRAKHPALARSPRR